MEYVYCIKYIKGLEVSLYNLYLKINLSNIFIMFFYV